MQQVSPTLECARRRCSLAPRRAVGERQRELTRLHSCQRVAPFAPPALPGFSATTRRSDFCPAFGSASLRPLPSSTEPSRSPRVSSQDFPPPPLPIPRHPGWISGVALGGTLARVTWPLRKFTFVRCCGSLQLPSHTPSRENSAPPASRIRFVGAVAFTFDSLHQGS